MNFFESAIIGSGNENRIFESNYNTLMFLFSRCFLETNDSQILFLRSSGFLVPEFFDTILSNDDIKNLEKANLIKFIKDRLVLGTWECRRGEIIFRLYGGNYASGK
ncbi:MAG: hypothetical protein WC346_01180 [Methanogenium sp.]|jgi:hypothetical protein